MKTLFVNSNYAKKIVVSRYPDAEVKKWAKLAICIWCPLLDRRLSGFFHTEEEAWISGMEWILNKKKLIN